MTLIATAQLKQKTLFPKAMPVKTGEDWNGLVALSGTISRTAASCSPLTLSEEKSNPLIERCTPPRLSVQFAASGCSESEDTKNETPDTIKRVQKRRHSIQARNTGSFVRQVDDEPDKRHRSCAVAALGCEESVTLLQSTYVSRCFLREDPESGAVLASLISVGAKKALRGWSFQVTSTQRTSLSLM